MEFGFINASEQVYLKSVVLQSNYSTNISNPI